MVIENLLDITKSDTVQSHFSQTLLAAMPGHVYWKNREGEFQGCNKALAAYFGFSCPDEIIGLNDYDLLDKPQADHIRRLDKHVMSSGKGMEFEDTQVTTEGKINYYLVKLAPLRNSEGRIIGIMGISFDVSAEKQKQELEKEKKRAEMRAEFYQIAACSIAHELRTPLTSLRCGAEAIERFMPELVNAMYFAKTHDFKSTINNRQLMALKSSCQSYSHQIHAANTFINMMLRNLKTGQVDTSKYRILSMFEVVNEVMNDYPLSEQDRELITINLNDDFQVLGDLTLTKNIFFNLIKNALYFIREQGRGDITITVEKSKKHNIVRFRDTAKGIPLADISKIFTRYYSKREGGTGVGLAYCQLIMQSMGGNISCVSEEGVFTEFLLKLPMLESNQSK